MVVRSAVAALLLIASTALPVSPALALEDSERLWFVGERALADNLLSFAAQTLERFVQQYPNDRRVPQARMMIGRARLTLGENDAALDAFRRAQKASPPPGAPFEARFWEAEVLFRLQRYGEAREAYEDVVRGSAGASFAPDALYSYGWTDLELKRPEPAVTAFREFLKSWPEHRLAPSAMYQLGRALVELKKFGEAVPPLGDFVAKYPDHKLVADARYLVGWARVAAGDGPAGLADLKTFVAKHPAHTLAADARKLITDVGARVGDKHDLETAYAALMKETPATADGLITAVAVATKLGRVRDQEGAWKKLQAEFPDHPMTAKLAFDLANAAFKRKDWSQAAMLGEAAARTDDPAVKAEAWLLAGEAELKLKKFGAAVKAFEAVGAVRNVDGGLRYRALAVLGLAREELKDHRAALDAYESVASASPDPALREWARERADALKARLEPTPATAPSAKPRSS